MFCHPTSPWATRDSGAQCTCLLISHHQSACSPSYQESAQVQLLHSTSSTGWTTYSVLEVPFTRCWVKKSAGFHVSWISCEWSVSNLVCDWLLCAYHSALWTDHKDMCLDVTNTISVTSPPSFVTIAHLVINLWQDLVHLDPLCQKHMVGSWLHCALTSAAAQSSKVPLVCTLWPGLTCSAQGVESSCVCIMPEVSAAHFVFVDYIVCTLSLELQNWLCVFISVKYCELEIVFDFFKEIFL